MYYILILIFVVLMCLEDKDFKVVVSNKCSIVFVF